MIDYQKIPVPDVIEPLDFEGVLADICADFRDRFPDFDALVESDPAIKLLEAFAYREILLRARINDAARAIMLPRATGADLDNLAANYGIQRKTGETDAELRERCTLAFEAISTAGSRGAYRYHALSVGGVKDVSVTSPTPGLVHLHIRKTEESADADALCKAVFDVCNADDVRPLTDTVEVFECARKEFEIVAVLKLDGSLDSGTVLNAAKEKLEERLSGRDRIGYDITRSFIAGALTVEGVADVEIKSPETDITTAANELAVITGTTITTQNYDESEICEHD